MLFRSKGPGCEAKPEGLTELIVRLEKGEKVRLGVGALDLKRARSAFVRSGERTGCWFPSALRGGADFLMHGNSSRLQFRIRDECVLLEQHITVRVVKTEPTKTGKHEGRY